MNISEPATEFGLPLKAIDHSAFSPASHKSALEQRYTMTRLVSIIIVVLTGITSLLSFGLGLIYGIGSAFTMSLICGTFVLLNLGILWSLRPGSSLRKIEWAGCVLCGSALVGLTYEQNLLGSGNSVTASFLFIPVLAAIIGFKLKGMVTIIALTITALVVTFSLEKIFKVYPPGVTLAQYTPVELGVWVIVVVGIAICVTIFAIRLNRAVQTSEEQAELLRQLLLTVNSTTEFGSSLGHELRGITAELNATSRQQAASTQEQVAAVTQVTTSLEELSETARQIATAAQAASQSANGTVELASEVKGASEIASSTVAQGDEAVMQSISSVERVRNRIELLGQRLLNLTEQTRKVGTIIDIIDQIAAETHLLALNASIEAAGSVLNGGATNVHTGLRGERFGIIAQEIKGLSDRSREATEEVRQAIGEMQGAVAAAVLVAEEGKKETSIALSRSQISGLVISKLNEVISGSAAHADQILRAVEEVNLRCDEISIATGQQRSASQQILVTMRSVGQVARESAGSVGQLSETVARVNTQVGQLNGVLDKSKQSLRLVAV